MCVFEVGLGRKCVFGRLMGESTHFFIARNSQGESLRPISWKRRQKVTGYDILKKNRKYFKYYSFTLSFNLRSKNLGQGPKIENINVEKKKK